MKLKARGGLATLMTRHDTKGATDLDKMKPVNLNVSLGNPDDAQGRRKAYEKRAAESGAKSLGAWARELMDKDSGYKKDQEAL